MSAHSMWTYSFHLSQTSTLPWHTARRDRPELLNKINSNCDVEAWAKGPLVLLRVCYPYRPYASPQCGATGCMAECCVLHPKAKYR